MLIHDGARPFVTEETIRRVIEGVAQTGAAVAAVPVRDTIKQADEAQLVCNTPERSMLWQVQTPQGFLCEHYRMAHQRATKRHTDDAGLMEEAGFPVRLVLGGYENIKLTSTEDLKLTAGMFVPRIGMGFDAHRLTEGRALWLGGVQIPYEKGLLGHSDADVALHALMDAMFGAAGLGDIGKHFPDTDAQYKGISSLLLLAETEKKVRSAGFEIGNVDLTIVAQAPKLAPYIGQMRETIGRTLHIPAERVSMKATTTEGMGFEGRGQGISAQAAVMLFQR